MKLMRPSKPLFLVIFTYIFCVFGQDKDDKEIIKSWINQLGDVRLEARERAVEELIKLARQKRNLVRALLNKELKQTEDFEVKTRIRYILNKIAWVRYRILGYGNLTSLDISPDGRFIVCGLSSGIIQVWDIRTKAVIKDLYGHSDVVRCVCFSPDGKIIASASDDRSIKLWDFRSAKEIATLKGHKGGVMAVEFSPAFTTDKILASGSHDKTIKLWNTEQKKEITTVKAHKDTVSSLSFSPDTKFLASGSWDDTIKIWNVKTGKETLSLIGHEDQVNCVAFHPEGKILASGSKDGYIKLWDIDRQEEIVSIMSGRVSDTVFSPDGRRLVFCSSKRVYIYELKNLKESGGFSISSPIGVAFCKDGRTLVAGGQDYWIELWNLQYMKMKAMLWGHHSITSLAFSHDAKILATGSRNKTVVLWDLKSGKRSAELKGHRHPVIALAFSPDGKLLASRGICVKLWNTHNRKERDTIKAERLTRSPALMFSPDSKVLAFRAFSFEAPYYSVKLLDINNMKEVGTLPFKSQPDSEQCPVAFSRDAKLIACVSDWDKNIIEVKGIKDTKEPITLKGHKEEIMDITFPENKETLMSFSEDDAEIRTWNLHTWECTTTVHIAEKYARIARFFSEGKFLLTCSYIGVKIWRTNTGKEIKTLLSKEEARKVTRIAISMDGEFIAISLNDGRIIVWQR